MAIAFRPPEVSSGAAPATTLVPPQNASNGTPLAVSHQQQFTVQGPQQGILFLSPTTSAVIQHHGMWVSNQHPHQVYTTGFPPIYQATAAVPQYHRVAYHPVRTPTPTTTTSPTRATAREQCCRATQGCCTTCEDIRRGKYSCLVYLFRRWRAVLGTSGSILDSGVVLHRPKSTVVINFVSFTLQCTCCCRWCCPTWCMQPSEDSETRHEEDV